MKCSLVVLTVLAFWASSAFAQEISVTMGKNIADEYCSECHSVRPDGPFKQDPPSFAAIAKYRSADQIKQRIISPRSHQMPRYTQYMIGGNIDDMVAYIVSLE